MYKQSNALLALEDFLSLRIFVISLISFVITLAVIYSISSLFFDNIGSLKSLLPDIIEQISSTIQEYSIVSFILEHKALMYVVHILLSLGIGIFIYYIFFGLYAFIISFFNIFLIKYLQNKYYSSVEIKGTSSVYTLFFYLKTIAITVLFFIIFLPVYLIPGLNLLIFFPIYYFFHKTIIYDVSSEVNTYNEYRKIKKVNAVELKTKTGFCFLLSLIPLLGILIYPYYVLYLGHYIMQETEELRYIDEFKKIR